MRRLPTRARHLSYLAAAVAGTLVPTRWVAFPAAAVLVLWLPGWLLVGRLGSLRSAAGRGWLALAASFALLPVALNAVWHFSNARGAVLACVAGVNLLLLLLPRRPAPGAGRRPPPAGRGLRLGFGLLVSYVGVCVFAAYWLPGAFDRVAARGAHDYVKHHAVLLSLELYRLPLHSVFYAAEADAPYYYYEYHYYIPAALRKLTGDRVSIGFGLGFSSGVLAAVLVALVYLLARELLAGRGGALLAAACVSVVGGWDAVPVLVRVLAGGAPVIVLDSWCPIPWRAHNLMTQFFWCPQHVAGLVALLLGGLLLRQAVWAGWWLVLAPLLAASIFGSSVYLALTVLPAAAVLVGLRLWRAVREGQPAGRRVAGLAVVAAGAAGLMALQAWQYQVMSRRFPGGLTLAWERCPMALLGRVLPPGPLANYLDAPWMLLIDFGLAGLAGLLVGRRFWSALWRDHAARLLIIAGAIGLLAMYTLRSDISPFDYSFRIAIMPAQVVGAVCAGRLLGMVAARAGARRWGTGLLSAGVLLGLPVGLYEAPLMALRGLLLSGPYQPEAGAIRFLRHQTPLRAVVQGDPRARVDLPQLIDRQMGVLDPDNSHVRVFFPRDEGRMRATCAAVERAFASRSSRRAYLELRAARVDYVLAGARERQRYGAMSQFDDPRRFRLVYRDEHARVYRLRGSGG